LARIGTVSRLPVVYAYRDVGVLLEGTRWEPRRVSCTQTADHADAPGTEYVVKYRRPGRLGAAAVISEVVCHSLLRALQIRTLERRW
jgi:hypothetical protein